MFNFSFKFRDNKIEVNNKKNKKYVKNMCIFIKKFNVIKKINNIIKYNIYFIGNKLNTPPNY